MDERILCKKIYLINTMKLLYCKKCNDVFSLKVDRVQTCECGECAGRYTDTPNAVFTGNGFIIVIDNTTLQQRYDESIKSDPNRKLTIIENLIWRGQIGCFIMSPEMPNWNMIKKLPIWAKM